MLTATEIAKKIILIESDSEEELAFAFLRFSEYYENPDFIGKVFTLDEYAKWHRKKYGSFDYSSLWAGFNVPGKIFSIFEQGKFDPLSAEETALLSLLPKDSDYYVIGTRFTDVIDHELAHAFYSVYPAYKNAVRDKIKKLRDADPNFFEAMEIELKELGYDSSVWDDEIQAYAVEGIRKVPPLFYWDMKSFFKKAKNLYFTGRW